MRLKFPVTWKCLGAAALESRLPERDKWEMVVPRMVRPVKPALRAPAPAYVPSLSSLNDSMFDRIRRAIARGRDA